MKEIRISELRPFEGHPYDKEPTFKSDKEYEEWQKYKAEKANGHILLPDTVRFIYEANGYDAEKIGHHFLEIIPKICPQEVKSNYGLFTVPDANEISALVAEISKQPA